MKVLMLGWEFPPFISGGLGTACYGLTKAMSHLGTEVVFVLPKPVQSQFATHVRLVTPAGGSNVAEIYKLDEFERVQFRTVDATLVPYESPASYTQSYRQRQAALTASGGSSSGPEQSVAQPAEPKPAHYGMDLFSEVERYARLVAHIARQEEFDLIHAHDWMTYPAGIAASAITGRPLVVHVHSTEFDRSGEHVNQRIYDIERQGMHAATKIIAVSHLTQKIVASRYGVSDGHVEVVYNAIDSDGKRFCEQLPAAIGRDEKIVLFLGRITMQKGPEYFLAAAKRVLEVMADVRFLMAGSGDMVRRTIELAAEMGIGHKVLFTGFLRGEDVDRVFRMADLYVMPSVSEPFGIAPLEALSHDVPVIISKQSGVAEILTHVLKVDFWDINEMANKIIAVLRHPPLHATLREHGSFEIRKLSWKDSASCCVDVYRKALAPVAEPV